MDYSLLVMLLKDLVILPFQEIKLELKDEISKRIIKVSNKKYNDRVLVVSPNVGNDDQSIDDLPKVGVVAYIKNKIELSNGNLRVTLKGEKRVKVILYKAFTNDILFSNFTDIILPKFEPNGEEVIKRKLKETLMNYISSSKSVSNSIVKTIEDNNDLGFLTDAITSFLPLTLDKKHSYMIELNCEKRALSLIKDIKLEIEYNELEEKIDNNVEVRLTKEQESYYLKEKLKEIENTLGSLDVEETDINKYYELLNNLQLSSKTNNKLKNEIDKLKRIPISSPEYGVITSYLDIVLNLPWNNSSKEVLNVKTVINCLNKSHYGLDDVKTRI